MFCFGVTHHNPSQVLAFIGKNAVIKTRREVVMARAGAILPQNPGGKVVFIPDAQTATRNIKVLNSADYTGIIVFVFASALRLKEISGCTLLDSTLSEDPMAPGSVKLGLRIRKLRSVLTRQTQHKLEKDAKDYLKDMVDHVKRGSLLNPLMSFIYTLPSSTHQTPVKKACAEFFIKGDSYTNTLRSIERELGMSLTVLAESRLRTILTSDVSNNYRAFFKAYKSTITDSAMKELCVTHSTAPYEVRYLLSVCAASAAAPKQKKKAKK